MTVEGTELCTGKAFFFSLTATVSSSDGDVHTVLLHLPTGPGVPHTYAVVPVLLLSITMTSSLHFPPTGFSKLVKGHGYHFIYSTITSLIWRIISWESAFAKGRESETSALSIQLSIMLAGNLKNKSFPFLVPYHSSIIQKNREHSGTYVAPDNVVGVIHDISGKAKVTYFHYFSTGH